MQGAAAKLVKCGPTGARAIDILAASVTKVLAEPHKERYRIVDPSHPAMRPVAEARGGTEFLWAIGYEPLHGHLVLQSHDPAQLRVARPEDWQPPNGRSTRPQSPFGRMSPSGHASPPSKPV